MPSIGATIDGWNLPTQLREQFIHYILQEDQGYSLEADVDEAFTFTDEELKAGGIVTARERKLLLAKLKPSNLLIYQYDYQLRSERY